MSLAGISTSLATDMWRRSTTIYAAAVLAIAMIVASGVSAQRVAKVLLLKIRQPDQAWAQSNIAGELQTQLSRNGSLRVRDLSDAEVGEPAFPEDYLNLDSLVDWGNEMGGRYLLLVDIGSQGLETRKTWHLPLVIHRYSTVAVARGELRLVDLSRGTLMAAEPFEVELKAAQIFQATMDDDPGDPDLHVSASNKIRLFRELDKKLCDYLVAQIGPVTNGR